MKADVINIETGDPYKDPVITDLGIVDRARCPHHRVVRQTYGTGTQAEPVIETRWECTVCRARFERIGVE